MRNFVRQSNKRARCSAVNQNYGSFRSDNFFNFISKKLNVKGKLCEIIEEDFQYTNKNKKTVETENDSQFDVYRDNKQNKTKYIEAKLSELPRHEKVKKKDFENGMTDFVATSLHPSAIWDENSVY